MKVLLIIISFINGAYMLLDGVYVIRTGKYIGPPQPGPWAQLFNKFNIDVFKLGPLFIAIGAAWLIFIYSLLTYQPWAFTAGVAAAVLTLWYLPFGSVLSIIVLVLLFVNRQQFNY
ncbi:hypothetical protein [uncultured Chitinophaga sp.]|uniref:hypothetical protein n=1 Tax=uncultured Chitinophaga sp. TaxID=339340 RepID=UPI0025F047B2|nr:hypothetical protein [uncultured Chitinophaga sp.]